MFQKGIEKMGGRKAGTPNRLTSTFREAVLLAYDTIGGHEAFSEWALENQTEFYRIASRLIPAEMGAKNENIIVVVNRGGTDYVPVVEQHRVLEDHSGDNGENWEGN